MFAVQCSFCQHENVPGARFCAECGSPLHLRVCPNPDCGKVSDVNAMRCEHCGTVFPKIALAEPGKPDEIVAPVATAQDNAPAKKPAIAAWPLIIVAIFAGGLPLLWFNRAHLPAPKPWQPDAVKPTTEPMTPPVAVPSEVKQAPAPTPVMAATVPPPPVAAEPAKPETVAEEPPQKIEEKPVAKAKPKSEVKKIRQTTAPVATAQSPRPCTEAVAALGLCDPKSDKK